MIVVVPRPRKRWRPLLVAVAGAVALVGVALLGSSSSAAPADTVVGSSVFGDTRPAHYSSGDPESYELGVKFSSDVAGTVTGVRFFQGWMNRGAHVGTLWDAAGQPLASVTFPDVAGRGWRSATFDRPVHISAHADYTASYSDPQGMYSVTRYAFQQPFTSGHLTVGTNGGVYDETPGRFPRRTMDADNYFVDVMFTPSDGSGGSGGSGSPTGTPTGTGPTSMGLARVPWEGGPAYYAKFPGSSAFTNPNVFPIGIWWGDFDSDANVKWDKAHGITFYTQLNGTEDGRLLDANDMYVVQGANPSQLVKNLPFSDPHWAGWFLSDETDGRYDPPSVGLAMIQKEIDAQKAFCPALGCKFDYANYTGIVTSDFNDAQQAADEKFVNAVPGAVSVDGYYYTDPSCDSPSRRDYQINAPDNAHCRTSAAYGNFIDNLRTRDEADGSLQPLWGFVENGAPSDNGRYITPDQMKGAVVSELIHEARGIVWFNQSFSGNCQSGNVIRSAEQAPTGCNGARVEAMREINTGIQAFAPVLNTQSYAWDFGAPRAATMLKAYAGSAWILADVALDQDPGSATFTLPPGVSGTSVEVVGEGRTLTVTDGHFTDSFAQEYSYHLYRVTI